jgi:hypothetical protein
MSKFQFKPEISKSGKLDLNGRGLESLDEIIDLFSNNELLQIETLSLDDNNIANLDGIEKFKSLSCLSIKNNKITEIRPKDIEWINSFDFSTRFKTNPLIFFQIFLQGNPLNSNDFLDKIDFNEIFKRFIGIDRYYQSNDKLITYSNKYSEIQKGETRYVNDYCNFHISITIWADDNHKLIVTHPYHTLINDVKEIGYKNAIQKYSEAHNCTIQEVDNIVKYIRSIDRYGRLIPESATKSKPCFIATATMGSFEHPVVIELREFRDSWILSKDWGYKFVSFYYKFGHYPASVIEKSKILRLLSFYFVVKPLHFIARMLKK